jgi:hypothetical protein
LHREERPTLGISIGIRFNWILDIIFNQNTNQLHKLTSNMKLKIALSGEKLRLELIDKKKIIDSLEVKENTNMSKCILLNIDKIFKRNKISKKSIVRAISLSKIPEFYTSGRIIKSVEKSFNFAIKNK